MLKPVRPSSVVADVTLQLSQLIRDGHLKPGDQLPGEPELAAQLGVGRSTVREAKHALVTMGLIHSEGKRGTFVSIRPTGDVEMAELRDRLASGVLTDIYEARLIIEVAAAGLAARRHSRHDIAELENLLRQIEEEESRGETWPAGLGFHIAVAAASHNQVLASIYSLLAQFVELHQSPYYKSITSAQDEIDGHRILLEAIKSGDADVAADAMRQHIEDVVARRERAIDDSAQKGFEHQDDHALE
jgi:DNA-binding FadR family transcriptional regulator